MDDDPKIVGFPQPEISPEEAIRRQRSEAERLAALAPGEWPLWIERSAAQLDMPRATLEASVKALIAEQEKARRERKADDERHHRAQTKRKEREFKLVAALPERERGPRLASLAEDLGEDHAAVREGFARTTRPPPEIIVPWPEPVETAALLEGLIAQLQRFIVFKYDTDPAAAALWIAFAWVHDIAIHSPILAVMAPDINCGKSTMLGALKYLTPRPFAGVELTGPSLFRRVDRDHPTLPYRRSRRPVSPQARSSEHRQRKLDSRHPDSSRRTGR